MKKTSRRRRISRRKKILRFGTEVGGPSHGNYTEELKLNKDFVKNDIKVGQKDVLFIIDMQYDFVDQPFTEFNDGKERIQYLEGGAFSAPESSDIVPEIAGLVPKFKQSLIIATKDYHPKGHCSFKGYPPHCVVGSKGAKIVKPIWKAIRSLANAYVAFKGFHPEYDSYSALKYNTSTPTVRCQASDDTSWTGSFVVKTTDNQYRKLRFGDYDRSDTFSKQYNPPEDEFEKLVNDCTDSTTQSVASVGDRTMQSIASTEGRTGEFEDTAEPYTAKPYPSTRSVDPSTPNAVRAQTCDLRSRPNFVRAASVDPFGAKRQYLDKKSSCKLKHVEELLTRIDKEKNNIFICGLVGDICVLDTAINLKKSGYENVYIIFDLTRMVYIPEYGEAVSFDAKRRSGYLMSPKKYADILKDNGIQLIESKNITLRVILP